jgi:hypothetical protein
MKNYNLKLKIIPLLFSLLILNFSFLTFHLGIINAQASIPLVVMPARNQIEVTPGEKTAITISFYNQSDDPVSGFFKTADFIVEDTQGTPRLIENPEDAPVKYSASRWLTLPYDRATLPAHDKVTIQTDILVPNDAHPGGRYAAVFFQQGNTLPKPSSPEEIGSGTNIRIASLIYIRVKGPITEKALISRFFVPSFFEYGPIKVTTDILNRGDYHIAPRVSLSLTNAFGGLIDQKLLKVQNIFPDSSRNYVTEMGAKWMIGRYKVSLAGAYGDSGQALTAVSYVWVFPWRVALAVILTIIIVIFIVSNLYKNIFVKETSLEKEVEEEKEEIEKLKQQLRKRE